MDRQTRRILPVFVAVAGLLPGVARAHLPHEPVLALAAGSDFADSGAAWLVLAVDGSPDGIGWWPYATHDHGAHWDPVARPPTPADIRGLGVSGARLLLATDDAQLWVWDGAAWAAVPLPSLSVHAMAVNDEHLALATDTGVLVADAPEGPWTTVSPLPATDVAFDDLDPDRLVSRTREGAVLVGDVTGLAATPAPPLDPLGLASASGVVYVGGHGGVYALRDGDWAACGALPISDPTLDEGDRVTRLLVTADTVRAATGQLLYASSDGCATFHEEDPFHEVAVYDAGGGTSDGPSNAYVGLVDGGGYTLTAGYRGAVLRTPTFGWHSARLLDAAFVRAFQIANTDGDEPDALHLWVTSYGGGLLDMAGGGASFRMAGPTGTLEGLFGRDVGRRASGDLVYAGDLYAYASADDGETLRRVDVHTDHLLGVRSAGGRSWALGARGSSGALSTSMDGLTWTPVDLAGAWPTDIAGRVLDGEDVVVARLTTPSGVAYTADAGATWTSLGATATEVLGFATWPPGVGTTLVRSAGDGVSRSTDHGASWVPASVQPDLPPARLLVTGADGIVGFDGAGRLWQSTDGGDTWAQRGTALPSPQDWLEWQDRLVVATVRGLVWSDDLGDTWRSAPFVDDLTPLHEALVCLDAFGAVVSCADRLTPGVRVRFSTRAARFTVATDAPLSFDVQVGGVALGAGSSGHSFELPAAAWSDVDLTVTNGFATLEGVRGEIDGERILGAGYVNDTGDTGDSGGTGGGDSGDAGDSGSGGSGSGHGGSGDSADSANGHSPADADPDAGCACGIGGGPGAGLGVGWLLALALLRRRSRTSRP